jgi:hypothetical protein
MWAQQKITAAVIYVEVWGLCKGNTNGVGGTVYTKLHPWHAGSGRKGL